MKKFITLLFIFGFILGQSGYSFENITIDEPVSAPEISENIDKTLQAEITFDWIDISQAQRDEQIGKYRNMLFGNESDSVYYTKEEFKNTFKKYYHDKDFKHHYMLTNNGVTEDEDAKYCAFYFRKNTLIMYAIQYKNNPHNAFYYTAFGKLYYVDVTSDEYPNYPYHSMQYNRKGELKSAIYFISKDMQYMFGPDKQFQGLWYKDKMYNAKGKQTLTRTNW